MSRYKSNIRWLIYSNVMLCLLTSYNAKVKSYSKYTLFEFIPKSEEDLGVLNNMPDHDDQIEIWDPPVYVNKSILFHVSPERKSTIIQYFASKNLKLDLKPVDMDTLFTGFKYEDNLITKNASDKTDIELNKFYSISAVDKYLELVAKKYSKRVKVKIFGYSYEKRPLIYVKISDDFNNTKPVVMIDCGIHAREWMSHAFCIFTIHELTRGYEKQAIIREVLRKFDIIIIPILNPDGYEFSKSDRFWRRNRNPSHKQDFVGVDLNRNFERTVQEPFQPETYPGPYPFSEPESQAFKNLNLYIKNIHTTITVHSYGNMWLFPFGNKPDNVPNYDDMMNKAMIGASALKSVRGTKYRVGSLNKIISTVDGDSVDWQYDYTPACYSYALELPEGKAELGFILSEEDIAPINKETFHGMITMLKSM